MNLTNQPVYEKHSKPKRIKDNDSDYLAWLRLQQSAYSGIHRNVVAAHYRTAANAGIAIKPLYSAIPLTRTEHNTQHRIGQFQFASREWWELMVSKYQTQYLLQGGEIPKQYRAQIYI